MFYFSIKKDNITYKISNAENIPFEDNSIDIITVGTPFHSFLYFWKRNNVTKMILCNIERRQD